MLNKSIVALALASLVAGCAVGPESTGDDGANDDGVTADDDGVTSDDDGGDSLPADPAVEEFFRALAEQDCADAFACRSNFPEPAEFETYFGATESACVDDAMGYYDAGAISASIDAGRITWNASAATQCVAGLNPATCSSYWDQGPAFPAACEQAYAGTVADGGACSIDFECASFTSFCDGGTCVADAGQ